MKTPALPLADAPDAVAIRDMLASGQETAAGIAASIAPARSAARALNAFIPGDCGMEGQVEASDARYRSGQALPLDGIPVSVKDNVALDGLPTTGASRPLAQYVLPEGMAVRRLRDAGLCLPTKPTCMSLRSASRAKAA